MVWGSANFQRTSGSRPRLSSSAATWRSAALKVDDFGRAFLRLALEAALNRHPGHQRALDEAFTAFLRIPYRGNQKATVGGPGEVVDLPGRKPGRRVHRRQLRSVLVL